MRSKTRLSLEPCAPAENSPAAPAILQTEAAWPAPPPAKSPPATAIPGPPEPWVAPRSSATAASPATTGIGRCTPRSPRSGPAARAFPHPSLLHPDMARTTASPAGTAVRFFLCPSWHHLGPSTPSSNPWPRGLRIFRRGQPQLISYLAHIRREPLPQRFSAACQARLHRAQRNLQHLGNLLVRHLFQIAENQRRAIWFRQLLQLLFHPPLHLVMRDAVKRRVGVIGQRHLHRFFPGVCSIRFHRLNRSLARLVPEPPPPAIRRLVQRNAIDPRLQTRLAVKLLHPAKHIQKDVLRSVGCVRRIIHDPVHQPVHRLLKLANQPRIGLFRAGLQLRDDSRFFLRPNSDGTCQIPQGGCSRHIGVP